MESVELAAASAALLGLWMVGLTHIRSKLVIYGLQSIVLGSLAMHAGIVHSEITLIGAGLAIALLKGLAVPIYLGSVARKIGCRRDDGVLLAPPLLMLLTLAGLVALLLLRPYDDVLSSNALPAVGLVLIGMVLMVSRRLAVSQILGFLVLENGMYFYTISQPHPMPTIVELGVLMDVLAGTMLAGLLAFRINDSFEHIDVTELRSLRG